MNMNRRLLTLAAALSVGLLTATAADRLLDRNWAMEEGLTTSVK